MSKYQGVQKFKKKVIINDFWKFFSIRAVIGRSSSHESWEILLLFVQLDTNGIVLSRTLFESDLIRIIEEIREFDIFEDFLNRLFQENIIQIGGTEVLLEFVRFEPSHVFIERKKTASKIGVDYSGDLLIVKGGAASKFQQIKNHVDGMLLTNDRPYESLDDLIYDKLRVNARWVD